MTPSRSPLTAVDRVFLDRAYELAQRGTGSTSPNPPAGAAVVRGGRIVGEGYHHRAGEAHAEVEALRAAGSSARGATLFVSLEPCDHHGRTPPCTQAVAASGVVRVVAGVADPNPLTAGRGFAALRKFGVAVVEAEDERARFIVEPFARAIRLERPYVALKLAVSLDGYVAHQPGVTDWLTGDEARAFVRELRIAHDAVAVGAETVRVDDPQLTVRPPHDRRVPYTRVLFGQTRALSPQSKVFSDEPGYARTIVVAPAAAHAAFAGLGGVADLLWIAGEDSAQLDLPQALRALRARGLTSLLCEGGPTLASRLIAAGLVDRLYWIAAPRLMAAEGAVLALAPGSLRAQQKRLRFDRIERLGADVLLSGTFAEHV